MNADPSEYAAGVGEGPGQAGGRVAVLLRPSGAMVARIPLPAPVPAVLTYEGRQYRRSHDTVSGVAFIGCRLPTTAIYAGRTRARRGVVR